MEIKVRDAGKVQIVELKGKLVLGDAETGLMQTVQKLLDQNLSQIVLNLRNVSYMDTSGIGSLVACKKRAINRQGDVKLVLPPGTVYEVLSIMRLHMVFSIFDDEKEAVGSF